MSATASNTISTVFKPKAPITITPAAALKSWELIQEEQNPNLKLRVSILGGGCHGFRYEFSFTDKVESDDTVITECIQTEDDQYPSKTVDWVVGMVSLQLLKGVEIDYESVLGNERFILRHLKVKTTCSCGQSFTVPEADKEEIAS